MTAQTETVAVPRVLLDSVARCLASSVIEYRIEARDALLACMEAEPVAPDAERGALLDLLRQCRLEFQRSRMLDVRRPAHAAQMIRAIDAVLGGAPS